jgi:hypothetical protein
MITREHRNQLLVALGFIVPIVLAGFVASWAISTEFSALSSRVTGIEHDQEQTERKVDAMVLRQADHDTREAAADDRMAETLAYLKASWDMYIRQDRFKPGRFSR